MEHWLVDNCARLRRTSMPSHTPERRFIPIKPDGGFSSIKDVEEYASDVSDISDTPCAEKGSAAPRLRSPTRKSARGGKRAFERPRPSERGFERKFALLTLQSSASSLSLDFSEFASPSSKASLEDSTRARAGSYYLTADNVTSAHDLRRLLDCKQRKKLAKADKKRRGTRSQ